ncbi:hypothetical protein QP500_11270, partial [Pauljensenia sp. UMB0018B]|nr:hypothetical protein [Pauljensenia sp. UMB0018B]
MLALVPVDHSNGNQSESASHVSSQETQGARSTESGENKKTIRKANEEVILENADGNKASLTIKSA